MSTQRPLDPTAGERARQIRDFPGRPQPILDPTDPRQGLTPAEADQPTGAPRTPAGETIGKPR